MDEYIPQLTLTPDLNAQPQPEVKQEADLITKAQAAPEAGPDLSALSEQEQQAVLAFSKQIDLENAQQILEYGASAQKNIADFSDTALAKVKTGDLGEIGDMLSGLLVELKTMDEPEKKGIAGLFRKAKINAEEMKSRFATAEVNVDRISGELEKHQVTLLKDIAVLDQMYDKNKKTGKLSIRTAHSLNPVPFIIYDNEKKYKLKDGAFGLANVAGTVAQLLGIQAPDCWEEGMIAE